MTLIDLKTAANFTLLAGTTLSVTDTAATISGDVGANGAITGVSLISNGSIISDTAILATAFADLTSAYVIIQQSTFALKQMTAELGGQTLVPGTYTNAAAVTLTTGNLTLDGPGKYIFQCGAAVSLAASVSVQLINGALPENVIWQVTGAFSTGAQSTFVGVVLCQAAIAIGAGATVSGQLLSIAGAVAFGGSVIQRPSSAAEKAQIALNEQQHIVAATTTVLPYHVEMPDGSVLCQSHEFGESLQELIDRLAVHCSDSVNAKDWRLYHKDVLLTSGNFKAIVTTPELPCVLHKSISVLQPVFSPFVRQLEIRAASRKVVLCADKRFTVKFTQRQFAPYLNLGEDHRQQIWIDKNDHFIPSSALIATVQDPIRIVLCDEECIQRAQLTNK